MLIDVITHEDLKKFIQPQSQQAKQWQKSYQVKKCWIFPLALCKIYGLMARSLLLKWRSHVLQIFGHLKKFWMVNNNQLKSDFGVFCYPCKGKLFWDAKFISSISKYNLLLLNKRKSTLSGGLKLIKKKAWRRFCL